jgi:hypothetical protein
MATTAWTVTARKRHSCDNYPRCYRGIKPGEDYARHVAFPGDDANNSSRPWVLNLCQHCHTEHGREMPPRRTARKKATRV